MAYYSDSAKARILAIDPQAANWINSRPRRPAATTTRATNVRSNQFPDRCQHCHGHVAAGQGVLGEKIGGRFTVFHADGTCPDKQHTPAAPEQPQPAARPGRPNKYAGPCITCGARVAAESGLAIKTDAGWKTSHHDGQCPAEPTAAPQPHSAAAPGERPAQVNKYPGRCADCGQWVQAEAGHRTKTEDGTWATRHQDGQCPDKQAPDADGGERIELTSTQIDTLPIGYYTVELDSGEYRTFRIRIKSRGQRNEGKAEICYLGGPNNLSDYWLLGIVQDGAVITTNKIRNKVLRTTLDILLGDPHAAQLGYARAAQRCYRCGHPLTTPESLDAGIGPECANK